MNVSMDLGKVTMASNTGLTVINVIMRRLTCSIGDRIGSTHFSLEPDGMYDVMFWDLANVDEPLKIKQQIKINVRHMQYSF